MLRRTTDKQKADQMVINWLAVAASMDAPSPVYIERRDVDRCYFPIVREREWYYWLSHHLERDVIDLGKLLGLHRGHVPGLSPMESWREPRTEWGFQIVLHGDDNQPGMCAEVDFDRFVPVDIVGTIAHVGRFLLGKLGGLFGRKPKKINQFAVRRALLRRGLRVPDVRRAA